ncbi:Csu type fimbrial protein [Paraburkholderia caballeronis]|uniref:Spore coat protein U (SCPU) domain-containing protein n=1 Tax=Paraburkholderia caballeronis TaxID=416943 RepID=A0A1H7FTV2_9BURK|nr:spore coat protein U domain-containing protein [Paraburkholderia caballeronis]PXW24843.1 spore coat protein U-like protein [Paraburkholderia caballeronis]PXX00573.1 spore coat protein U-like protein [Paraburkholderia caballeronis]RAJ98636.1 spore coat protein U-like protein [Paraburkholderia caballeronis]TDV16542.1 spore coat protein U-like protein [Paraburkholderia caballeronis]TDV18938.1 spore coat protein U-like protein [Paraburkholderia caballeronis]
MNLLRVFVLGVVMGWLPAAAWAATLSTGNASFGNSDSVTVQKTALRTSSSNQIGMSSSSFPNGYIFPPTNLVTENTSSVALTLSSANGFTLSNAGYGIPYRVYADASYSTVLNGGVQTEFYGRLVSKDRYSATFNLYFQTTAGANVPVGVYRDTINVRWDYKLCTAVVYYWCNYNDAGSGTTVVNVELVVAKGCQISSAPDVNFGTRALVASFTPVTQSVTLTCGPGQAYRTYFTDGDHYDGAWKRMVQGSASLQYNLYVPGTGTPWDSRNKQGGTGTGQPQSLPYTAQVNAAQPEQPAGAYGDSVSIVVEY